jgi:thiol-disulfide isomerase/thioredoxin/Flp pilus assembly protein TadD
MEGAMHCGRLTPVIVSAIALVSSLSAQAPAARQDTARLRTLFFQRNFEVGAIEGQKLAAAAPESTEPKAWLVLNLARSGKTDEAVALARELSAAAPKDPWATAALAAALHYQTGHTAEANELAQRSLDMQPDHPDLIWLRGQTMAADPKRRAEVIAFIDGQRSRLKNPAEILNTKGYTLYAIGTASQSRDDAKVSASFEVFAESRKIDPANVNAHYLPATYLSRLRRHDEAYPLLKTALTLAPASTEVHQALWTAVRGSQTLSAEQKQAEIAADIEAFLRDNDNRPGALLAVANAARESKLAELQRRAEEKILADFNDSREAEWVLTYRLRALERAGPDGDKAALRKLLTEYIARPRHHHTGLLGEAYRDLFQALREDSAVAGDELYRIVEGMLKYETMNPHIVWVQTPIALAERKTHLKDAERIARDGIEVLRKKVESQKSFYDGEGEYESAINSLTALGHDALGWVLFLAGRTDEAEKELLKSYELDHDSRENLHHLGRFYESTGDLARAEEYYVKGLAVQRPGTNPSEGSLKALYAKRNGSDAGFDGYLAKLKDADRVKRKEKILGERDANPSAVPAFALKSLHGTRVSLESLKGKIVVINFWGIWCGWCVKEMPDFQKLHENYKGDPDVAILTIDNDENPADVPPWMKQKNYTFAVLLDDGYVAQKAKVTSFPTTWFLDREGKKAFVKAGWSEKLVEEFTWRIEALRGADSRGSR